MNRRPLLTGGAIALLALIFAFSQATSVPTAKAQPPGPPQPSTVSLDMVMCDGAGPLNAQPHCANAGPTTSGNDNGLIEEGENPEVQVSQWSDLDWTDASDESFFDLASIIWTAGPPGPDQTGDGWEDPLSGLAAHSATTLGAAMGEITFKIQSNLTTSLLLFNNVDDAPTNTDATVMGQPPVCDTDRIALGSPFEMWVATTAFLPEVHYQDIDDNGCIESQEDSTGGGGDGDDCTLEGPPKGVTMMPFPTARLIVNAGLPISQFMGRAFGIARLPIPPPPDDPIYTESVDVNLLAFNFLQSGGYYLHISTVGYPGQAATVPAAGAEMAQTVATCLPYHSSPSRVFGITVDPDFDGDGVSGEPPHENGLGGEANYVVMNHAGPFELMLQESRGPDYDGDGIGNQFDRCRTDPTCGTAGDDPDGDWLCGTCDPNPGTGCAVGEPRSTIPWHTCQDADGDGWMNAFDNCPNTANPTHEDSDGDGVGDVCDPVPEVDGDGSGYAGGFNDGDNWCFDQFTIGLGEPAAEPGVAPPGAIGAEAKYCLGPASEVGPTQQPYVNPPLAAVGVDPYLDSNDDGTPDYVNVAIPGDVILQYDADNDADRDGHSDGCEAFNGTDALDPASTPGAPAVAGIPGVGGDCDGGGELDYSENHKQFLTDPFDPGDDWATPLSEVVDTDEDGCIDSEEMPGAPAPNPGSTGAYDPTAWYDFYDVPIPAMPDPTPNGPKNQAIAMDDVLGVLFYVGTYDGDAGSPNANGVGYDVDKDGNTFKDGRDYDRAPGPTPNPPWDAGPPSGAIAMDDVLAVLAQTGLSCIGAPDVQLVDVEIWDLFLTVDGTPQPPGSIVEVPWIESTILDVMLTEHVVPEDPAHVGLPVQVKEYVYLKDAPDGLYHCVNGPGAADKLPPAERIKWQECTIDGEIVDAGLDNDGDTLIDEDPVDGVDNDGDQLENGGKAPLGTWPGECTDTNDNDGDTLVDGADPDCTNPANPGIDEDSRSASAVVEIPDAALPTVRPILDVAVEWELLKSTVYTKIVNMIHFGDYPGPWAWSLVAPPPFVEYPILVCAKEIPEPPAVETDWSDNVLCTPYTLQIFPP